MIVITRTITANVAAVNSLLSMSAFPLLWTDSTGPPTLPEGLGGAAKVDGPGARDKRQAA